MQILALLLAVFHGINGVAMLVAPDFWFASVPGASDTGAFNPHFIRDIGLAFIGSAGALLLWRRNPLPAVLLPAAIFLGGHAGLHLVEMVTHGTNLQNAIRDLLLIAAPGFLPVWLALRGRQA